MFVSDHHFSHKYDTGRLVTSVSMFCLAECFCSCHRQPKCLISCALFLGYVPATYGHYIQNVGTGPLVFLEIFKTHKVEDVSLAQASVPPRSGNNSSLTVHFFDYLVFDSGWHWSRPNWLRHISVSRVKQSRVLIKRSRLSLLAMLLPRNSKNPRWLCKYITLDKKLGCWIDFFVVLIDI